jgi:hypothetical protein
MLLEFELLISEFFIFNKNDYLNYLKSKNHLYVGRSNLNENLVLS